MQARIVFVSPIFVHTVTDRGVKTIDEYLVEGILFVLIFTTNGFMSAVL